MYPIKLKIEHKFCLLFSRKESVNRWKSTIKIFTDTNIYIYACIIKRRVVLFSQVTKIVTKIFQSLLL